MIPGSLIAIIVVTIAVYLMKTYGGITCIDTIGDRFDHSVTVAGCSSTQIRLGSYQEFHFRLPSPLLYWDAIESLLSAAVADGVIGDRHDSNHGTDSPGRSQYYRSAVWRYSCYRSHRTYHDQYQQRWKNSPVAGIIHAVILLLILLFLMPLAQYIPMACLAGVLVIVSYNMSGWRVFKALL